MNKLENVGLIALALILMLAPASATQVRGAENPKAFLNTTMPGLVMQVNATETIEPGENITVTLAFQPQSENDKIEMTRSNLSIFGFYNGTEKVLLGSIVNNGFTLDTGSRINTSNFATPATVWGVTYGEIVLTYLDTYGGRITTSYENLTCGFTMTLIENTYLRQVEEGLGAWNSTFAQLNQTFWNSFHLILSSDGLANLNNTYWELQQNYTSLQNSASDLDNTRRVAVILGVTTAFFLITTFYVVMRRQRDPW